MQGLSFTVTSGLSLIKSPKSQEKKAECLGWVASSGLLCVPQSGVFVQNGSKSGFNQMYLILASRDEVAFALDSSSKQHFAGEFGNCRGELSSQTHWGSMQGGLGEPSVLRAGRRERQRPGEV